MIAGLLSLAWYAGSALMGLLLVRVFPRLVAEFLAVLDARPLPSLGLGALVAIGALPAALLAAVTVVGLPVAALLVTGLIFSAIVGWLLLAVATGTLLIGLVRGERATRPWIAFLAGLVVLQLGASIPFVGLIVKFVGVSMGVGALLITVYHTWRRQRPAMPVMVSPALA